MGGEKSDPSKASPRRFFHRGKGWAAPRKSSCSQLQRVLHHPVNLVLGATVLPHNIGMSAQMLCKLLIGSRSYTRQHNKTGEAAADGMVSVRLTAHTGQKHTSSPRWQLSGRGRLAASGRKRFFRAYKPGLEAAAIQTNSPGVLNKDAGAICFAAANSAHRQNRCPSTSWKVSSPGLGRSMPALE